MADNDTLNIRVYTPDAFQQLNRSAGLSVENITEIEYFDPVLELKPVWINARHSGVAQSVEELSIDCSEASSVGEIHLEYNLLIYLAEKHHDRGESDEAERIIEEAVQMDPNEPTGYVQWAVVRVERGDVKGALILFQTLTDMVPDFVPGWIFRANCEESLDLNAEARKSLAQLDSKEVPEQFLELIAEIKSSVG
jgi:tetratricopeptide (TPR) repeat protein